MATDTPSSPLRNWFASALVRRGWRPSKATPVEPAYLGAKFGYDGEKDIKAAIERVRDHTLSSYERLASLWQQVRYVDRYRIPGCLVECGVWKGGSTGMMALAHLASGKASRTLHLFDSFEGLPQPNIEKDGRSSLAYAETEARATGELTSIGLCVAAQSDCQALLETKIGYPSDLVRYHVGWFEKTVAESAAALGPIALLRLDGDWYESTRICLQHLYHRVVKGGVIVIDDYGHFEGCHKALNEFLAALDEPVLLGHIDYTGRYWVKLTEARPGGDSRDGSHA